jgi:hypothetical protein
MTHYYTAKQAKQVSEFVDNFTDKLGWIKTPDGIDSLSDTSTLDDGSISQESMVRWFIMYALDEAIGDDISGEELHDLIASAVLGWAMQSFDQEHRDALKPIYNKYVND